jgi:uncharacterized protein
MSIIQPASPSTIDASAALNHDADTTTSSRVLGFDLARAYAIFGMFIVNFTFCFGSFQDATLAGKFAGIFVGNSTAIFIILAGMGVSLMANRKEHIPVEKAKLKSTILKRSWFLFAMGLLLFNWWPGDILHFYGGYMHIAAFVIFAPKKYYLLIGLFAILAFHLLLQIIPIGTSWNFATYKYADFWTPVGFLRNTLYNGWNAMLPWLAYFMLGMYLGRLNWKDRLIWKKTFFTGLAVFSIFQLLRYTAQQNVFDTYWTNYIASVYFPAYIPFMAVTCGFALMLIPACMLIAESFPGAVIINALVKTGRMTLSFYVLHVTLGMLIFSIITGHNYTGYLTQQAPIAATYIVLFSTTFYVACVVFSIYWTKKFKSGPLETLMRKISG